MYKEVRSKIKKSEPEKDLISEEEAVLAIKQLLLKKSFKSKYTEEELEKSLRSAFRTGLTALSLIHGAHYMGQGPSEVASKTKETMTSTSSEKPKNFKQKQIGRFVSAINTSSGAQNISDEDVQKQTQTATKLYDRFGGDESKMAYAWHKNPEISNDDFSSDEHSKYKENDMVEKYHQSRNIIEKTPYKPIQDYSKNTP